MINAYPAHTTVLPGGELILHVSTAAPQFRVRFYRYGRAMVPVETSQWLTGTHAPAHLPYQDWGRHGVGLRGERLAGWPAYRFPIGEEWRSGVYIAVLVEGDGHGRQLAAADGATPDARDSKALFVVGGRAGSPAPILYKIPLLTYHAYNRVSPEGYHPATGAGGWSLYTVPERRHLPVAVPPSVSLRRPGGGTGGTPSDVWNFDPFDATPRQTFVHWDAPFIRWIERQGYEVDYCTDLDVHRDDELGLLRRHRLVVSVGHDEYWSDAMRDHVERFVHGGGNLAFFGGNTAWWRVTFDDEFTFRRVGFWCETENPCRPENTLTGVSFRNGGERDLDRHEVPVGYRVQHAGHWVYSRTGLRDGDTFGDGPGEYLVGYECDGAEFDRRTLKSGEPARPSGADGTPGEFTILGVGDLGPSGWGTGTRAATMGLFTRGGTVFTAATTDWSRLLAGDPHPVVERVTRNVLDRLSRGGAAESAAAPAHSRRGTRGSICLRTR